LNNKGQLFSLDLIIAIAIVIFAIGLLYRQAELFQYFSKDSDLQSELYRIGLNASNQLVSNPAIVCQLDDSAGNTIDFLPNCFPQVINPAGMCPPGQQMNGVTMESLGIPEGYGCYVEIQAGFSGAGKHCGVKVCDNQSPDSTVKNVFSIERRIILSKTWMGSGVSKKDFDDCISGSSSCVLKEATLSLQVWKE